LHERDERLKKKVNENVVNSDRLYQVLKLLKDRGMVEFSFDQLDVYMQNMGEKAFNFDTFKTAYDTDLRIQEIVKNFNQDTIDLKDEEMDDVKVPAKNKGADNVSKMAKRATKVGDI
tara:strand:+ start:9 stop:359 length:351 start_codon:yes stop_codon:yes gene_type:complete